ncbi:sensor of ECF-type sigma factor [Tenacibaculum piscium]|uniref:Sensor of ECF-type sigma factor n=1 Tax=Tenacibaculum piscium TaxID=1458515 RepID=A0A2H1YF27_9FLAO|nr:sensor of ECF-type sigma factor [Tenacibaculum piscium]MBE7628927.1 sensor of ECF-type sigma factor [Tenacibaculum piscium]MBE7671230.1 sensor of ECF-type sigma factor [Tenacibaculum piscium]MBE7685052.1 sensor of ECF-type sigma factor [Tenacibaculum piscium]MBE7689755.1 sensor of ECF-type sigma factor [Tenacibaculum piscium]MCG8183620.1 sensor of ECF-type sigma factor [Tenacibaculum piscium]
MKKNILLVFLIFFGFFSGKAQSKKGNYEKIRTYKIAYLTEKLNLTDAETKKFWPIYHQYDQKMRLLRKEKRFIFKKKLLNTGQIDEISEKESKEILEKIQRINKQEYEMRTLFYHQISKVISFKKILRLQVSEHNFNRKLMRKLKNKNHKKRS